MITWPRTPRNPLREMSQYLLKSDVISQQNRCCDADLCCNQCGNEWHLFGQFVYRLLWTSWPFARYVGTRIYVGDICDIQIWTIHAGHCCHRRNLQCTQYGYHVTCWVEDRSACEELDCQCAGIKQTGWYIVEHTQLDHFRLWRSQAILPTLRWSL